MERRVEIRQNESETALRNQTKTYKFEKRLGNKKKNDIFKEGKTRTFANANMTIFKMYL